MKKFGQSTDILSQKVITVALTNMKRKLTESFEYKSNENIVFSKQLHHQIVHFVCIMYFISWDERSCPCMTQRPGKSMSWVLGLSSQPLVKKRMRNPDHQNDIKHLFD